MSIIPIGAYHIDASDPDNVKFAGTDMGPKPVKVWYETTKVLVVKIEGHGYWSGVAMQSYAPASFKVLEKTEWNKETGKGVCTEIVDFNIRK